MRVRFLVVLIMSFVSLVSSAHSVVEQDGYFEVEHSWKCNGKICSVTLNVSSDLYDYYQNEREHLAYRYQFNGSEIPPNYFCFMLSEQDRLVIRTLADDLNNRGTTEKENVDLAMTFVQSLPYAFDSTTKGTDEYLRYPIETLVDGCGDCEDKVALLAALLYEMDVDFILLVLPEHMAIGVHCDGIDANRYLLFHNKRYFYIETTMEGWQIGQIPEHYYHAEMEAVPLDDTPSLLIQGVRFESQPTIVFEKSNCTLELDLYNLGPGKVTGLQLHVWIVENRRRKRRLAEESYWLKDLKEGEQRTEMLLLKSLIKENCVLQFEVTGNEILHRSYEMELSYNRTRIK